MPSGRGPEPSRPKVGTIERDDNAWLARAPRTEQEDRLDNLERVVEARRGRPYLDERRAKAELARVDADLTRLGADVAVLEERRSKLLTELTG